MKKTMFVLSLFLAPMALISAGSDEYLELDLVPQDAGYIDLDGDLYLEIEVDSNGEDQGAVGTQDYLPMGAEGEGYVLMDDANPLDQSLVDQFNLEFTEDKIVKIKEIMAKVKGRVWGFKHDAHETLTVDELVLLKLFSEKRDLDAQHGKLKKEVSKFVETWPENHINRRVQKDKTSRRQSRFAVKKNKEKESKSKP